MLPILSPLLWAVVASTLYFLRLGASFMDCFHSRMRSQLANLSKSYFRKQVLKHLHAEFEPGQIVAILGENGAGKTTLLQIMADHGRPCSFLQPARFTTTRSSFSAAGSIFGDAFISCPIFRLSSPAGRFSRISR